jgi:hypothetical protein
MDAIIIAGLLEFIAVCPKTHSLSTNSGKNCFSAKFASFYSIFAAFSSVLFLR